MSKQVRDAALPGVVYTKPWVVEFMLDAVGYEASADLGASLIIDPGCGDGAFLLEIVERLLSANAAHNRPVASLIDAVRAFDIDSAAIATCRRRVREKLITHGAEAALADSIVASWIHEGDFLLASLDGLEARWIVGNPPYVRLEDVEETLYRQYRAQWPAISGRADIYIGFFQAALSLLGEEGRLAFICADRWMHNQYGSALRRQVINDYAMDLLFEMHGVDVFSSRVAAYPAITVMRRGHHSSTVMATARPAFTADSAQEFLHWYKRDEATTLSMTANTFTAAILPSSFKSDSSWPSGPPERLLMISDLESRYPSIADVGVTIGVGMATGADKIYVVGAGVDVEPEQLKPAIGPSDLVDGEILWKNRYIVSPWNAGELIDLDTVPRLRTYFAQHEKELMARYVARKNVATWWRTIDRPKLDDYAEPKLIVADINDRIEPVLDTSGYWPLHSAYFIKSSTWDIEALGGYLLSDVAAAFVEAYSVKMANGHLRVSAQYLKRIRIPRFEDVSAGTRESLTAAFRSRDRTEATRVVRHLVGLVAPVS